MSFCYLFNETSSSEHKDKLLASFEDSISLDINSIDSLEHYDTYVVELEITDQDVSSKLNNLFKDHTNPLIYFIIPQKHTLMLIQLMFLLGTKDVFTEYQSIEKIVSKINTEKIEYQNMILEKNLCRVNPILGRVAFMEFLREKLLFKNKPLSALTIGLREMKKLQEYLNPVDIETYLQDMINFMDSSLNGRVIFAEVFYDFYVVIFEDIQFDEIKEKADKFHNDILNYIAHKNYKSIIDIYTINIEAFSFENILHLFESIRTQSLSYEEKKNKNINSTSNTQTVISEDTLLEDAFREEIDIKLINIYNGLVISTPSKVLKKNKEGIYVSFEQLQGVVMKKDRETVLQSSSFLHDIHAEIKVIDIKKKVAFLEKFTFLKTNVNSRKYARVTTTSKIPITINYGGQTINGHILDISIKSIAIITNYSAKVESVDGEHAKVSFNIPNYRFDIGYTQLNLGVDVMAIVKSREDQTCKLVCDFDSNSNNEAVIMDYVYDRQKELIIEVKKMSKLI